MSDITTVRLSADTQADFGTADQIATGLRWPDRFFLESLSIPSGMTLVSKDLDLLFPLSGIHAVFGLLPPVTPSPILPLLHEAACTWVEP